jgi:hypothetical protein
MVLKDLVLDAIDSGPIVRRTSWWWEHGGRGYSPQSRQEVKRGDREEGAGDKIHLFRALPQ